MNKCGHDDCFTCPFPDCIVEAPSSLDLSDELRPLPKRNKKSLAHKHQDDNKK